MGRFCEKIVESWVISMVVVCSSRVTLSKEPHPWIYERRMVFIQKSGGHQKILGEAKSKMDEFMYDSFFTIANINLKKLRWRIEVRREESWALHKNVGAALTKINGSDIRPLRNSKFYNFVYRKWFAAFICPWQTQLLKVGTIWMYKRT